MRNRRKEKYFQMKERLAGCGLAAPTTQARSITR